MEDYGKILIIILNQFFIFGIEYILLFLLDSKVSKLLNSFLTDDSEIESQKGEENQNYSDNNRDNNKFSHNQSDTSKISFIQDKNNEDVFVKLTNDEKYIIEINKKVINSQLGDKILIAFEEDIYRKKRKFCYKLCQQNQN
jgi:small nuclear ribonucleoprotein (snRNP)-like protein